MLNNLLILFLTLALTSCAGEVIKRNSKGRSPRKMPRRQFKGVKKRIALLQFFNESPYGGDDLGVTATEEFRKEIVRTGDFIIDPLGAKIFGSSKEVYVGGGVKLNQLVKRAKMAGINFVVFGRVVHARIREKIDEIGIIKETKAYTESKIEIRVFNVNTAKEIFTRSFRGYADDTNYTFFVNDRESKLVYRRGLLRYAVKVAVRRSIPKIYDLASRLEWVGRVARIVGNQIYVNAGRSSGIQISDILKVFSEGEEIYDPETGALIGQSKGSVKGTLEIIDYFGPDGSIAILHSGGSVLEGDYVQLY